MTKTTATTQIAALQTLQTEEGKETVLSLTLKDGSNVKYLIKSPTANALGCRQERRNFETEGFILGYGTITYGLEYRRHRREWEARGARRNSLPFRTKEGRQSFKWARFIPQYAGVHVACTALEEI